MTETTAQPSATETPAVAVTETKPAETTAPATEGETPSVLTEAEEAAKASEAAKALAERKQTYAKRIGDLTRDKHEAIRRAERAEAEAKDLRGKLKEPDPATFDDISKLNAAQVDHSLDKREVSRKEAEAVEASRKAQEATEAAWVERSASFRETTADFDAVVRNPALTITRGLFDDIMAIDEGPQVLYTLGKHDPARLRELCFLPDRERAFALGKIAEKLASPPRRTTQAPPPITGAVTGKSAPTTKWANLSAAEYAKAVREEMKR